MPGETRLPGRVQGEHLPISLPNAAPQIGIECVAIAFVYDIYEPGPARDILSVVLCLCGKEIKPSPQGMFPLPPGGR